MRISVMLLVFVLGTLPMVAQQPLRVAALVAAQREAGQAFGSVDLLQPAPTALRSQTSLPELRHKQLVQAVRSRLLRVLAESPATLRFQVPTVSGEPADLELVQVSLFSDDFQVRTTGSSAIGELPEGIYYRGIVRGDPTSVVALSFFPEGITGIISSASLGNQVISPLGGEPASEQQLLHVVYEDQDLQRHKAFDCLTADSGEPYRPEELAVPQGSLRATNCVRIALEVDNDIYQDKGGSTGATQFVTGMFNEVATLYANEGIRITLSSVLLWDSPSPYTGTNIYTLLQQFQSTRSSIDGDLGQLLTYKASGGIAVVDGLCRGYTPYKLSVVSVSRTFNKVPDYSYSVMAMAHELGHLFGSQHTHACVWNGDNTAIDGCAGRTEGSCPLPIPSVPVGGGTIMSYCHITSAGINLSKGFGTQPGNLIRNKAAAATCLVACPTDGGSNGGNNGGGTPPSGSGCTNVKIRLVLDLFGAENTWSLRNSAGTVLAKGGPYTNKTPDRVIEQAICLPNGCYVLDVFDTGGDGLCCAYGNGSIQITDEKGTVLVKGDKFTDKLNLSLCLEDKPVDNGGDCLTLDFNTNKLTGFGGLQDRGSAQITDAGAGVTLTDNAWKAVALNYTVTANTKVAFEFRSTSPPEIAGIGFDTDDLISSILTFQVYGLQTWGQQAYNNYSGNGQWKTYVIPVGQFYTGTFRYLTLIADDDRVSPSGNASFRNVRIYEGANCATNTSQTVGDIGGTQVKLFPNPSDGALQLFAETAKEGSLQLTIFNLAGQAVHQRQYPLVPGVIQEPVDLYHLPPGAYFYRWSLEAEQGGGKLQILR
ncbi:MAG: hypothetical protein H6555_04735 [Lewinellaceae bacterium]|nr:hypothetical protein [Lewinellaceae bacterium]